MQQIALLNAHCTGKGFHQLNFGGLLDVIKQAEGGSDRAQLGDLIREQNKIEGVLNADTLTDGDRDALKELASRRDAALTGGRLRASGPPG